MHIKLDACVGLLTILTSLPSLQTNIHPKTNKIINNKQKGLRTVGNPFRILTHGVRFTLVDSWVINRPILTQKMSPFPVINLDDVNYTDFSDGRSRKGGI